MTPEEMNNIADALMVGLQNRFPAGIDQSKAAMVMASLSVKFLHDSGVSAEDAKKAVVGYVEGINLDDITPVSIN